MAENKHDGRSSEDYQRQSGPGEKVTPGKKSEPNPASRGAGRDDMRPTEAANKGDGKTEGSEGRHG